MKTPITNKKAIGFYNFAQNYLESKPTDNKLTASIRSVLKQIIKYEVIEEYNDRLVSLKVENALTDPGTHELLKNEDGSYKMSAEGVKALNTKVKALLNETVTLHARVLPENKDLTKDFHVADILILEGLVIPEESEDKDQPISI